MRVKGPKLPRDWEWTRYGQLDGKDADWRPGGYVGGYISDYSEDGWKGVAVGRAAERVMIRVEVRGFKSFRDAINWVEAQGETIGTAVRKLIRGKGLVKMEVKRGENGKTG